MQAKAAAALASDVFNPEAPGTSSSKASQQANMTPEETFDAGFMSALRMQFQAWCEQCAAQPSCQTAEARALLASMKREAAVLLAAPESDNSFSSKIQNLRKNTTPIIPKDVRATDAASNRITMYETAHNSAADIDAKTQSTSSSKSQPREGSEEIETKSERNMITQTRRTLTKCATDKRIIYKKSSAFFSGIKSRNKSLAEVPGRSKASSEQEKYIIPPDSSFRIYWDFALMILIFYYAAAVPVRVAFDIEPPSPALENFFTTLFLIDIVLNFNTGITVKGDVVMQRTEIAKIYMQKWFWIDVAASFPFDWIMGGGTSESGGSPESANKIGRLGKIFRLLRIAKMLRMLKLGRIMVRIRQAIQVSPTYLLLVKTLLIMLATWHWSACIYWIIATNFSCNRMSDCEQDGIIDDCSKMEGLDQWCPPEGLLEQKNFDLNYAYAFFWGISATTGVGYEIFPYTQAQIAFSSIIVILGSALYCNILASMTSIIQGFTVSSARKVAQLETIFQYLRREPATSSLRRKIRAYYDFMWTDGLAEETTSLIERLPASIQIQIATDMHADVFENIELFSGMHKLAVFYMVKHWKRLYVVKGDKVIEQGDFTSDLCIVFRGRLAITTKSAYFAKIPVGDLKDHDYFGEVGLVADVPVNSNITVSALQTCELLIISKQMYISMLAKFELSELQNMVRRKAASTMARVRWKRAIFKIVLFNRFLPKDEKSSPDKVFSSLGRKRFNSTLDRRKSLVEILASRIVKGVPKAQVYAEVQEPGPHPRQGPPQREQRTSSAPSLHAVYRTSHPAATQPRHASLDDSARRVAKRGSMDADAIAASLGLDTSQSQEPQP